MIITTCTPQTHLAQLELIEQVFHPRMRHRYPWLLSESNLDRRFVALANEKVVGALNYWVDTVLIDQAHLSVASIGAVATHPDYRHQGIASKLLEASERSMRQEGVDVVIISGSIDLYVRYGALRLSSVLTFEIPPRHQPLTMVPVEPKHFPALKAMYDQNPFRFERSLNQMAELIEATSVPSNWMNTVIYTILEHQIPVAYAVVTRRPNKPGAWIREFGGDPNVLPALADALIKTYDVPRVILELIHNDPLVESLQAMGWRWVEEPMESTLKVINFPQLIAKLHDVLAHRNPALADLSVKQRDDQVTFTLCGDSFSTTARIAQQLLFGPWPKDLPENHPVLAQLKGIVPIPWVYPSNLNYQ